MVLATIIQCALFTTLQSTPNAADAWYALFDPTNEIEIPQGPQSEWTELEQAQYKKLAPLLKQAREIALMEHCDWNLDYSQGFELLLPHLSYIRQAGHLVSFSIQEDVAAGNFDSALSGMESIVGMSKHLHDQRTVISSLVSYSVFKLDIELASVIDKASNPTQLESLKNVLETLNPFDPFGIRESVTGEKSAILSSLRNKNIEDLDLGGFIEESIETELDMDFEISSYETAMDIAIEIMNMPDKSLALKAANKLNNEIESIEHGELTKLFFVRIDRLIESAFSASEDVAEMQLMLQQRIDLLKGPNAETYFLQAADAYCAVDETKRRIALEKGEFAMISDSLELLSKAAEMQPTMISPSEDVAVPAWLAPIFALTIDGLSRGNPSDFVTSLRVAGHLSLQERLGASVTASMIVQEVIGLLPAQLSEEETSLLLEATRRVPAADAFMILATTSLDSSRLQQLMSTEEGWTPTPMAILAATITITKETGAYSCGDTWERWLEHLGVPDDDTIVLAAVTQNMPETLLLAEFENEQEFVQRLRHAKNVLPILRRRLTTIPARE